MLRLAWRHAPARIRREKGMGRMCFLSMGNTKAGRSCFSHVDSRRPRHEKKGMERTCLSCVGSTALAQRPSRECPWGKRNHRMCPERKAPQWMHSRWDVVLQERCQVVCSEFSMVICSIPKWPWQHVCDKMAVLRCHRPSQNNIFTEILIYKEVPIRI